MKSGIFGSSRSSSSSRKRREKLKRTWKCHKVSY